MRTTSFAIALIAAAALAACGGGNHGNMIPPQTRNAAAIAPESSPNPCPPSFGISVSGSTYETGQIANLTTVLVTYVQKIVLGHKVCEPSTSSNPAARWSTTGGNLAVLNGGKEANFSSSTTGAFTITAKYSSFPTAQVVLNVQLRNITLIADFPISADGNLPFGPVLRDIRGNFFGITLYGTSTAGCFCGSVYEIEHTGSGYTRRVLYTFQGGTDGAFPSGALAESPSGQIFGTTTFGGANGGEGTVYELTPAGSGYTESVIYRFSGGGDGKFPSGIVRDASGNLYGTSTDQYNVGNGVAYKLTPNGAGYTESVMHTFQSGADGSVPSSLALGPNGVMYGTTDFGGDANNDGTIFELVPSGSTYTERILYRFKGGSDGRFPDAVIIGNSDTLFGTTKGAAECNGQPLGACGTVFELTPAGSNYQDHVLYHFTGSSRDGANPKGLLLMNGVLYGTQDQNAYSVTLGGAFHLLHAFCGNPVEACDPNGPLVHDANGFLYGSAAQGGSGIHGGVVFKLVP